MRHLQQQQPLEPCCQRSSPLGKEVDLRMSIPLGTSSDCHMRLQLGNKREYRIVKIWFTRATRKEVFAQLDFLIGKL